MADTPEFVVNYLQEVETLAEDVLTTKQHIIELSKKQNTNREALSALANKTLCPAFSKDKAWVNVGGMFIKFTKDDCKKMIINDNSELKKEIDQHRALLPSKVNRLYDAQGKDELKGFNLKPLAKDELNKVIY